MSDRFDVVLGTRRGIGQAGAGTLLYRYTDTHPEAAATVEVFGGRVELSETLTGAQQAHVHHVWSIPNKKKLHEMLCNPPAGLIIDGVELDILAHSTGGYGLIALRLGAAGGGLIRMSLPADEAAALKAAVWGQLDDARPRL